MDKISFVVQGPVVVSSSSGDGTHSTADVLKSIRTFYPEAEIILSTWKGSDLSDLVYDELVLSDDPGGFIHNDVLINNNRLILSTKEGIKKATNYFVVKTRTDILITGNNLIRQIQQITPLNGKHRLFNRIMLSTIYYVRNPLKLNLVFHPSDIFLVGTKADLFSYFDVPAQSRDFFVNEDNSTRMAVEQYFFVHHILTKQNKDYYVPKWGYTNVGYFAASERYLFGNFHFFSTEDLGVDFPQRLYHAFMHEAVYSLKQTRLFSKLYNGSMQRPFGLFRCALYLTRYHLPYYSRLLRDKIAGGISNRFKSFKLGGTDQ